MLRNISMAIVAAIGLGSPPATAGGMWETCRFAGRDGKNITFSGRVDLVEKDYLGITKIFVDAGQDAGCTIILEDPAGSRGCKAGNSISVTGRGYSFEGPYAGGIEFKRQFKYACKR